MCGLLAFFSNGPVDTAYLKDCASRLEHRGNSSAGTHHEDGVFFYHFRLAFRDLNQGHQPMFHPNDSSMIIYNGELYGIESLRNRLANSFGWKFVSTSDTEVLLAAIECLGEDAVKELDGEFAFVYWNRQTKKLLAGRDPFGVKPIFFSAKGLGSQLFRFRPSYQFSLNGDIAFASEIKGFPENLSWREEGFRRQFLGLYEEMGTAYENCFALAPGSILSAQKTNDGWSCEIKRKITTKRLNASKNFSFSEAANELKDLIQQSVTTRLESDVPLGVYLSGGIDSRIAALALAKQKISCEAFTVGFEGADYDESGQVQSFIRHFPSIKSRLLKTNDWALQYAYPLALYHSEIIQPYTNGSAKWWLSRFARRYVRGVLTGDGADELFCGYPSYRYLAWWQFYQRHPSQARGALYRERIHGKEKFWEKGLSSQFDGSDLKQSFSMIGWFHPLFSQIQTMASLWFGSERDAILWLRQIRDDVYSYVADDIREGSSPLKTWQNYFLRTHFPTHVLNWVGDRMEMANTLEGRPIFLSQKILSFVQHCPDHALVRGMREKAILRKAYQFELGSFSRSPKKQFNAPFLLPNQGSCANPQDPASLVRAQRLAQEAKDPLQQSFARMFLQNSQVASHLEQSIVKAKAPQRDRNMEEDFLDRNTTELT